MGNSAEEIVADAIELDENGDYEGAEALYRKAAAMGSTDAMFNLAVLLDETLERPDEAIEWWRRLAEMGDSEAMGKYGTHLSATAPTEAEKWLRQAIESGSPEFRYNLVIHLVAEGHGDGAALVWSEMDDSKKFFTAEMVTEMLIELRHAPESAEVWLRRATDYSDIEKTSGLAMKVGTFYFSRGNSQKAADIMAEWYVGDGEPPYFDEYTGELVLPIDEADRDPHPDT